MFTTRRPDGHLVSRPMATQKQAVDGADFWFVTDGDAHKLDELEHDPPREPLLLPRPHARVGVGERQRAAISRDRRAIRRCTRPTGRRGSATRAARATAAPTTRA